VDRQIAAYVVGALVVQPGHHQPALQFGDGHVELDVLLEPVPGDDHSGAALIDPAEGGRATLSSGTAALGRESGSKLFEKPHVVLVKLADVGHLMSPGADPLDAQPEGEASYFFG